MKVLVKARILKLWLLKKAEIQLRYSKTSERFFWYSIYKDVESHINSCENLQKQCDLKLKMNSKLRSIPVPSNVIKQVDVDLRGIAGVDGYRYLIVCIEYFSKWSESEPITDKSAPIIARLLHKMMWRHIIKNSRPSLIEGVLFAHRASKHFSTKYSPFKLVYNREPVLPIDVIIYHLQKSRILASPLTRKSLTLYWSLLTSLEKRYIDRLVKT